MYAVPVALLNEGSEVLEEGRVLLWVIAAGYGSQSVCTRRSDLLVGSGEESSKALSDDVLDLDRELDVGSVLVILTYFWRWRTSFECDKEG